MDFALGLLIIVGMLAAISWAIHLLLRAWGWRGLLIIAIPVAYVAIVSQFLDNPIGSPFLSYSTAFVIMAVFGYLRSTQPDRRYSRRRSGEES